MSSNPQVDVRKAARAMASAGLSTAFGHCSVRLDQDSFLVCRAGALSTIKPGESGSVVPVSGSLPEGVLGEVRIHQQIYARRPEIGAVCRFASPNVTAVSALGFAPRIRHGFGAMFAPEVKYWEDIRLMRDDTIAAGVAQAMGDSPAIILRGNGAVTAGVDLKQALCLAWFLEDMARVELAVLSSGRAEQAPVFTAEEALGRLTWAGLVAERAWDHLTALDPELAKLSSIRQGALGGHPLFAGPPARLWVPAALVKETHNENAKTRDRPARTLQASVVQAGGHRAG